MVKVNGRVLKRGDIIQLNLDPRVGSEQSSYRPAIVISPAAYNQASQLVIICPITSRAKGWGFEVELPSELETYGVVLVDQIKAVDCRARKVRFIEEATLELVDIVLGKLETLVV